MSTSPGGATKRNRLNLTLPGSFVIATNTEKSLESIETHELNPIAYTNINNNGQVDTNFKISISNQPTFFDTASSCYQNATPSLSDLRSPSQKINYQVEDHSRIERSCHTNRISTAPVDVTEVLKRLEIQDLDDIQRKRLSEFVTEKQKIDELRPEEFEHLSELGKGNGGVVSRVRHTSTGLIMAKKNIHLEIKPDIKTQIIRELQVLHDCNSPYIVGYYGAYFAGGYISLCMEYMDGGSLDIVLKRAGRIPEPILSKILYSVLKGLIYLCETLHIIHRDVKPSNILVNRCGDVKLCDFGVSGQLIDSLANSFVGTRSYMAPERLIGEQYSTLSDVWSLGLSLIELATGRYPIPAIDENDPVYLNAFSSDRETNLIQHLESAKEGKPLPVVNDHSDGPMAIFELLSYIVDQPPPRLPRFCFSDDFIDLIGSCLKSPASDRPSLYTLLRHRFVRTVAGACPSGQANRQSTVLDPKLQPDSHKLLDPINIGRYLNAIFPSECMEDMNI